MGRRSTAPPAGPKFCLYFGDVAPSLWGAAWEQQGHVLSLFLILCMSGQLAVPGKGRIEERGEMGCLLAVGKQRCGSGALGSYARLHPWVSVSPGVK